MTAQQIIDLRILVISQAQLVESAEEIIALYALVDIAVAQDEPAKLKILSDDKIARIAALEARKTDYEAAIVEFDNQIGDLTP